VHTKLCCTKKSVITLAVARKLNVPIKRSETTVSGIGGLGKVVGSVTVTLQNSDRSFSHGNFKTQVLRRLSMLEKGFESKVWFASEYTAAMQDFITKDFLKRVSPIVNPVQVVYYLPHHGVVKYGCTTTKLRIVFDESAKSDNGRCLKGNLLNGPVLFFKVRGFFRTVVRVNWGMRCR